MELSKKDIEELTKIIKYIYDEERKHYEESDNKTPHIYTSLKHFNKLLKLDLEQEEDIFVDKDIQGKQKYFP